MSYFKSNENAISLIALIITIIVIIILAAVVIGSSLKTPEQANFARFSSDYSEIQSAVKTTYATEYGKVAMSNQNLTKSQIYQKLAGSSTYAQASNKNISSVLFEDIDGKLGNTGISVPTYSEANDWSINCETGEVIYEATFSSGDKKYYTSNNYIESNVSVTLDGNNLANDTFSIIRGSYVLTVPKGFGVANISNDGTISSLKTVNEINAITTNDIKSGIVVVDAATDANEFVWVPVLNINTMYQELASEGNRRTSILYNFDRNTKQYSQYPYTTNSFREPDNLLSATKGDALAANQTLISNILVAGVSGDTILDKWKNQLQDEFDDMIDSVASYKGFYVGRYETSFSTDAGYSKKTNDNGESLVNKNWYDMYSFQKNLMEDSDTVTSTMIWGCQWDQTMLWLNSSGVDIYDSSLYGTYLNTDVYDSAQENIIKASGTSAKIDAGATTFTMKNNIFDLGGNVYERTLEAGNTERRVIRGGCYNDNGDVSPMSRRDLFTTATSHIAVGSRMALYINND